MWHVNTYGDGNVLVHQPRHRICTNASRGLTAIAEFLVKHANSEPSSYIQLHLYVLNGILVLLC